MLSKVGAKIRNKWWKTESSNLNYIKNPTRAPHFKKLFRIANVLFLMLNIRPCGHCQPIRLNADAQ